MKQLFYIHWNEQELEQRLEPLRQLPIKITSHCNKDEVVKFADSLPDIFIVSLERLPSHGRQYVQWLWEAKKRQHIPVIFVDGKHDKIEETKAKISRSALLYYHTVDRYASRVAEIKISIASYRKSHFATEKQTSIRFCSRLSCSWWHKKWLAIKFGQPCFSKTE